MKKPELDKAIKGERHNFTVIENGAKSLEYIPLIINPRHFCNTIPDEVVVMTFVAYVCSRFLNLKDERY